MKDDSIYIDHILNSIQRIESYIKGMNYGSFSEDFMVQDAVVRQLEIIGEASKKISAEFRIENPHVPWADMAGMRDVLIHDYIYVDMDIVWKTVTVSIIELKGLLRKI